MPHATTSLLQTYDLGLIAIVKDLIAKFHQAAYDNYELLEELNKPQPSLSSISDPSGKAAEIMAY